jgi:hypothetical protein
MRMNLSRWATVVVLNVAAWGVLGAYQYSVAQSRGPQLPFANSNEQRSDILAELREIKELIREQNNLLREGASKNAVKNAASR